MLRTKVVLLWPEEGITCLLVFNVDPVISGIYKVETPFQEMELMH
jgi:hypothetical protein